MALIGTLISLGLDPSLLTQLGCFVIVPVPAMAGYPTLRDVSPLSGTLWSCVSLFPCSYPTHSKLASSGTFQVAIELFHKRKQRTTPLHITKKKKKKTILLLL
ncbi:uncharacterized protein B0T23DRAFT_382336 [Neurospora hispaniola]|uniref:Uncharacterized protein n=1 Tax=Neurospora hispaniola TaxID=588809 RepID=A0AAJ0I611_9PEZI|nr:hypothetical protein B0T23DRAFT_382336 [Neurospora hispaniola]